MISKEQEHTIFNFGLYLPKCSFSHGQLNIALLTNISVVMKKILGYDRTTIFDERNISQEIPLIRKY